MAEIYVPGAIDIMGSANQMMQFRNSQQAQQENAMRMQFEIEDRARAEQARKVAAGNALAEQARKRELFNIYSNFGVTPAVTGQRGQAYSGTGVANDPYAAIQNELLRKGFASQAGDIAELRNKTLTGKKTMAEIAEKQTTNIGIDYSNTANFIKMTNAQIDAALDIASLKAIVAATFTPGHPMAKFNELNGLTIEQSMAAIDGLIAQGKTFEQIREQMSQGASKAADNIAARGLVAAQTGSAKATTDKTVAETRAADEKRTAPLPTEIDIGGKKISVDMNPNSPTFKQILTSFDKTLTPAEAKPAAVVPTNLAKLLTEQAALPLDSPARQQYDAAIAKELAVSDVAQTDLGKAVSERAKLKPGDPLIAQYDAYIVKLVSGGALSQSPIGKLVAERNALPPGDPLIPQYNAAIAKETGSAGAAIKSEDAIVAAEDLVGKIDALLKHPGKSEAVGISFGTGMIPGTDAKGFIARHDEIKGSAFLDAYNSLRGTGSITEIEGVKATAAKNRMDLSTSEEEYDTAAEEYMGYIKRGIEREKARMQKLTGGADATSATAKTETPADIQSLVDKYK